MIGLDLVRARDTVGVGNNVRVRVRVGALVLFRVSDRLGFGTDVVGQLHQCVC